MNTRFGWGHINVNVSDLDASIDFYQKLGFTQFLPSIPYLNLAADGLATVPDSTTDALGLPRGTQGRACIMQLNDGFPKLDLTELVNLNQSKPLQNRDCGLVRLCLVSQDLDADYAYLKEVGVKFLSAPTLCHERLANLAICIDPDGTLIELLQIHPDRWTQFLTPQ